MRRHFFWVAGPLSVALVIGCGTAASSGHLSGNGGDGEDDTGDERAATSERFAEVAERFMQNDRRGQWSDAECGEVAQRFREVAHDARRRGDRADAFYMAGMALQRCGDRAGAQASYEAALRAEGDHCRARVAHGLAVRAGGDAAAAEQAFRTAIARDSTCAEGYLQVAMIERRRGELDAALTDLRRALAIDGGYIEALHEMSLVYLDRADDDIGALDLADVVARQAREVNPDYAPLYNTWGVIAAQKGDVVTALARFERAFTLDPQLFEAWMNFGQITLSFRGYEDAERAFSAALEVRPRDYDALIGYGVALRGLGRVEEAERRYEMARRLQPERPEAWFNLGILHQDHLEGSADDLELAIRHFQTFVEKADGDPLYRDQVDEVSRCCSERRRGDCRPGRLQNLRTALSALGHRSASGC